MIPKTSECAPRLMNYYYQNALTAPRVRHVLWLIENHPDSEMFRESGGIAGIAPTGTLFNQPADYERAKGLWHGFSKLNSPAHWYLYLRFKKPMEQDADSIPVEEGNTATTLNASGCSVLRSLRTRAR